MLRPIIPSRKLTQHLKKIRFYCKDVKKILDEGLPPLKVVKINFKDYYLCKQTWLYCNSNSKRQGKNKNSAKEMNEG